MSRINTLDGWRAIAILMVIASHTAGSIWEKGSDYRNYATLGILGVDIFFALSGLLITKLLVEEYERSGRISLKSFYIRRCFRVLLPCYIYLTVISSLSMIYNRTELLSSLFFLRNYFDTGGPYTCHLWSLAIEEHFYLLWPIALVWATVKYGQRVAMWGAVACVAWRVVCSHYFPHLFPGAFAPYRTDFRIDSLLWGCVFGFVLHRPETLKRTFPFVVLYVVCGQFDESPVHRLWFAVMMPLLIAMTASNPQWSFCRILDSSALKWIGKISYSLYLWQELCLAGTRYTPLWLQRFPSNVAMAFVLGTIAYYVVDAPLQRFGYRLAKRVGKNRIDDISHPGVSSADLVPTGRAESAAAQSDDTLAPAATPVALCHSESTG